MKEELLEPFLRRLRIRRVLPIIRRFSGCRVLDIGCGWNADLLRSVEPYVASGTGIDFKAPDFNTDKIKTIKAHIEDTLPFKDGEFDVVTMLAVLEHIAQVDKVVSESYRVLRPGGILCGTVPSKIARPVLEILSFKLHIVNPKEIADHKTYFDRQSLRELFTKFGFKVLIHKYFQFGMNNFFVAQKAEADYSVK
jgi:ubiquinone/menaquinone biosynthesis C-methylase UbiE